MSDTSTDKPASDSVPWSQWVLAALLMTAVFAGLEFMVYRSLAPLERGEPQSAAAWAPIAVVYELCGYSAAMAVIPAMWTCMLCIVAWQTWLRIRRSSASSVTNAMPNS